MGCVHKDAVIIAEGCVYQIIAFPSRALMVWLFSLFMPLRRRGHGHSLQCQKHGSVKACERGTVRVRDFCQLKPPAS